jgi:periplasmic protein TonB
MSSLGSLAECLMESDAGAIVRARRLRRKALVLSIAFEAVLIATMLVWPLITPGVLSRQYVFTPAPPYHGGTNATPARPLGNPHHATTPHQIAPTIFLQPPVIPPHVQMSTDDEAPVIETGPGSGGPGIPGGPEGGLDIPRTTGTNSMPIVPPPVEVRHTSAPIRRTEGYMEAALTHRVQPLYPVVAKTAHISGVVRLRAIIATDGSVRQLEVLSGNPILAQSAVAAVREWRYRPTRLDGNDVEVETFITVNFVLE